MQADRLAKEGQAGRANRSHLVVVLVARRQQLVKVFDVKAVGRQPVRRGDQVAPQGNALATGVEPARAE